MDGFRSHSRDAQVWRYQRAGSRAVSLEVRGFRKEAAEAWLLAASVAPRTDWQQFARQRAENCQRRCREQGDGKTVKKDLPRAGEAKVIHNVSLAFMNSVLHVLLCYEATTDLRKDNTQ